MANYSNLNKGALFLNDKKGNDKAPDRKGTLNVDGIEYDIAGWIKESKKGQQFLSISIQRKDKSDVVSSKDKPVPTSASNEINDEIPF